MKLKSTSCPKQSVPIDIRTIAGSIIKLQHPWGEIPWHIDGKTDPWDHVEAAMGLTIGGYYEEAKKAFLWLARNQQPDGSWYASYHNNVPQDKTHDTNMSSYIAVGLMHYHMITGDTATLREMWPTLSAGIDFAISLQTPTGEIHWAKSPEGIIEPMALLTGSSSVFMSLKCAIAIAKILKISKPEWETALVKLGNAIKNRPHCFNISKSRFSMDWFYPVLSGALTDTDAQKRIDKYWKKFVVEGQGILCVSDEPWITIAETSEFVLALAAMGNLDTARIIFSWFYDRCFEDGSYWCGFTFPDMVIWPEHKYSWTNSVVLMAADALYHLTPGAHLFNHAFWRDSGFLPAM